MTEQFHWSRLQVINWGVFDGYHSIPFSGVARSSPAPRSGKSSLLDAISLSFLLCNRRNFNASGDGCTSRVMYLRGDGTVWSAVTVTPGSDSGRTDTGLVLKRLTGKSRTSVGLADKRAMTTAICVAEQTSPS
jgi:P-loop containing region of AAA domain